MSNSRSLTSTAIAISLAALLAAPIPSAHAAGQLDVQAMMMDNFIDIAAVGVSMGKVCGASDAEIEQMTAKQKQQLLQQHGTLPADFDQRFEAAVARRLAQAEQMSPDQRKQACKEFTRGLEQMAERTRSRAAGD